MEWHAKILSTVVAASVPIEKGKENPLLEFVKTISLYPETAETEEESTVPPGHPPEADPAAIAAYGFDPEHPPVRDAPKGSFESAMRLTQGR